MDEQIKRRLEDGEYSRLSTFEMYKRYKAGKSFEEIAEEAGIEPWQARKSVRKYMQMYTGG